MNILKSRLKAILTVMLLAAITTMCLPAHAQLNRGETRKEKKERVKLEKLEKFHQARQLILDSNYIIPVESVRLEQGSIIPVAVGTTNYLKVTGDHVVLQYASGYSAYPGSNGLGGGTIVGKMRDLKITENEKKNRFFLTFILFGTPTARISVTLKGSDMANIDVDRMQYGRAFSLLGHVKHPAEVKTIEGTSY
jgi:hypothetical protein